MGLEDVKRQQRISKLLTFKIKIGPVQIGRTQARGLGNSVCIFVENIRVDQVQVGLRMKRALADIKIHRFFPISIYHMKCYGERKYKRSV